MLVIWQGYGYIALAVATLPLLACVGLIDFNARAGLLAAGVGFLVAGGVCLWANRVLSRAAAGGDRTSHTLYFIPLWVWGWIYGLFGLFFAGSSTVTILLKGWKN